MAPNGNRCCQVSKPWQRASTRTLEGGRLNKSGFPTNPTAQICALDPAAAGEQEEKKGPHNRTGLCHSANTGPSPSVVT